MSTRSLRPKLGLFAALSFAAFSICVFVAAVRSANDVDIDFESDEYRGI